MYRIKKGAIYFPNTNFQLLKKNVRYIDDIPLLANTTDELYD